MMKSPLVTGFVSNIDADLCRRDPDTAFRDGILTPLMTVPPPAHNLFILVDSVDESYLQVLYCTVICCLVIYVVSLWLKHTVQNRQSSLQISVARHVHCIL